MAYPKLTLNNKIYSYDAYGNVICESSLQRVSDAGTSLMQVAKTLLCSNLMLNDGISPRDPLHSFAITLQNPFEYNDERFDENTLLQYLRGRFYNPTIKRFIDKDTYDLLNRFNYVDADPIMHTDPTGHVIFDWAIDLWNSTVTHILDDAINSTVMQNISYFGASIFAVGVAANMHYAFSLYRNYRRKLMAGDFSNIKHWQVTIDPSFKRLGRGLEGIVFLYKPTQMVVKFYNEPFKSGAES